MRKKSEFCIFTGVLGVACLILWLSWGVWRLYQGYLFDVACEGHLKRAADANTVELAKQELKTALAYLNERNLTKGNTAILFPTPATDIGFWHDNLTSSLKELEDVSPQAAQMEKSNVLMKLRETLIDHGDKGDHVTCPAAIDVFPNVAFQFWFSWSVGIMGCILLVLWFIGIQN